MLIRKGSVLIHYGTPRHSGRYPYGSGKEPFQRTPNFVADVAALKKKGMSEKEIAKGLGLVDRYGEGNIKDLRNKITVERNNQEMELLYRVKALKDKDYSTSKIAEMVGKNESTIRGWLNPVRLEKVKILEATSDMLKQQLVDKPYLDVGKGVELDVRVNRTMLDAAIYKLSQEGYKTSSVWIDQLGTGKKTELKVLSKDNVDYQEIIKNKDKIRTITDWSEDGGETYLRNEPVKPLNANRILVKYKEDGGTDMDGMILLRRGVNDLSLGDKRYAQVRIELGDDEGNPMGKYAKGMAVYSNDIPDGYDIVYNSNKSKNDPKGAFKTDESDDPTDPFGTTIHQSKYIDKDGKEQLSPLNRVGYSQKVDAGEEGYWDTWALRNKLPSQFLSKQNAGIIKEQLDMNLDLAKIRLEDAKNITNPIVKQRVLDALGDEFDSKATHLEAAALPGQSVKVLMAAPTLKENEAYMPSANDGDVYGLIRFPHAGQFEIPVVTINNKNKQGLDMFQKDSIDVVAVNPKAAAQLSGADHDGDTVLAIPWSNKLSAQPALKEIINFDTKKYKFTEEQMKDPKFKKPTEQDRDMLIGTATNLITDMYNKGASIEEISRATRYSMVGVDTAKHVLDAGAAFRDFGIAELKTIYQGGPRSGASTLVSRGPSKQLVAATRPLKKGEPGYENVVRRGEYSVDKLTGKKVAVEVGPSKAPFINKNGDLVTPGPRKVKVANLDRTENAYDFISKNPSSKEIIYADYVNAMKALGNDARKESVNTPPRVYSRSANSVYQEQVRSLESKLKIAQQNAPLERQAQNLAGYIVDAQRRANPDMKASELKKIKGQALETARNRVGAGKKRIEFDEKEWEAIQAGALSNNKLTEIFNNSKLEDLQKWATPKESSRTIPPVKLNKAKSMLDRGYSLAEISEQLGISTRTVASLK